jgi:histidyl-tRNA synthetase
MILQAPKGFKDYLPPEALRRKFVVGKITQVFEKFGFDPLETPTLEYEETLTGKYGEEEKLIYKFETPGGDKVALKYDQTVPLARVVAEYGPKGKQVLPMPFKRYQIQSAYRGENTQKGRYREFTQCDFDVVGVSTAATDAEILAIVSEIYQNLGLEIIIKINDRELLKDIEPKYLAAIDKLNKIGESGVLEELQTKGLSQAEAKNLFDKVSQNSPSANLSQIMELFQEMGYSKETLSFDPTLIRGLDYYTGLIMEVVLKSNPTSSSLGGGGRWDKMIGKFIGEDYPASGYSVGLERTIEAMAEAGVLSVGKTATKVLVTVFSPELESKSMEIAKLLRAQNISTELWLDSNSKMDKQFKYADTKGIPYVVVIGPDEAGKGLVTLKNLTEQSQDQLSLEKLQEKFRT